MISIKGAPFPHSHLHKVSRCECWIMDLNFIRYKDYVILPHYYMWLRRNNHLRLYYSKLSRVCDTAQCVNPNHYKLVKGKELYCLDLKVLRKELNDSDERLIDNFIMLMLDDNYTTEW